VPEVTTSLERAPAPVLIERASTWLDATADDGLVRAGWSLPTTSTVVVGSAQRVDGLEVDGAAVVRRGTGGGAVICDESYLMLDVALPRGDERLLHDLAESYAWLAQALLGSLAAAGAHCLRAVPPAEVRSQSDEDRALGRLACFAGLGPYEIVDAQGRKLVGLAQRRRRGAGLFQAAMYLQGSREPLADLLPLDGREREVLRARLAEVATLDLVAPSFLDRLPSVWAD
jgi:lipoate-protein ligase A